MGKEEVAEEKKELTLEERVENIAQALLLIRELKQAEVTEEKKEEVAVEVAEEKKEEVVEEVEEVKKEEVEEVKKEEVPEEDLVLEARIDNIAKALFLLKKSKDAEATEEKKEEVTEEKKEEV